jgi:hypothetical protein
LEIVSMPRKRNLNAIPPESEPKPVPAESTSEAKSRLKSSGSKPAARGRKATDAAASVVPSTVMKPETAGPGPEQAVAAKDLEVSSASDYTKSRPRTPATPTKKASEPTINGTSFDADSYREEIARLAYSLWEERGRTQGSADEDWFRAEAEVRRRLKLSEIAA